MRWGRIHGRFSQNRSYCRDNLMCWFIFDSFLSVGRYYHTQPFNTAETIVNQVHSNESDDM